MKQRITYLLHAGEQGFDPSRLTVRKDSLAIPPIKAAKEHRLTFGFSDLPQEIWTVLKQCHELHLRWASPEPYTSTPPFVSRVSPGLHAFFTPRQGQQAEGLCPLLKKTFSDELKCESPKESFIGLPVLSERFSATAASQYHYLLPSLDNLVTYIQQKFCPSSDIACHNQTGSLLSANYLDIDFDTISHALIINAFWAEGPNEGGLWNEEVQLGTADKIEVGILNNEKPLELEELSLAGFLTVVGEDTKPKATLFSFPSRHHPLPSSSALTYSTSFQSPTGLHPTLQLHFPGGASALTPPIDDAACALHAYLTLPSAFFIDKYQLSDPLFLASQNLRSLRSLAGATDLEAPDWVVPQWGSAALLELALPDTNTGSASADNWTVSVPLHLRYLSPARNASGLAPAAAPWPAVLWACAAEEGTKMNVNPFDRINIGYDGLFGNRVMFFHVPPTATEIKGDEQVASGGRLIETVQVPVLDLDRAAYVEWGTVVAVLLGTAWVFWKLFGAVVGRTVAAKEGNGRKDERRSEGKEK